MHKLFLIFGITEYIVLCMETLFFFTVRFIHFYFISSFLNIFNCIQSIIGAMHHHCLLHVFYSNCFE